MSVFEARADLHDRARLMGWGIRGAGVIALALFVVLFLTGVIEADPPYLWFVLGFAVLFVIAMVWVLPASFQADAKLRTRGPLLEVHSDAIAYGGSLFPDQALRAVLRAELGSQEEHSRWVKGDAFYVYFDPTMLRFRRKDALIETKRRRVTIETSDFADPTGMARALTTHLDKATVPYVDCGTSEEELRTVEKRLTGR